MLGVGIIEVIGENIFCNFFENPISDAFDQPISDNHIAQRLASDVRCAGGVNDANEIGTMLMQIVNGLAYPLELATYCSAIGMMRLIGKDRQMRQAGNRLQAQISNFGARRAQTLSRRQRANTALTDGFGPNLDFLGICHHDIKW